jgi:flagellar biogenesis protein FliO
MRYAEAHEVRVGPRWQLVKIHWAWALSRLRHVFPPARTRQLRVRETLALGEKRQLLIVECGEQRLLIGAAGNYMATLAELPPSEKPDGDAA